MIPSGVEIYVALESVDIGYLLTDCPDWPRSTSVTTHGAAHSSFFLDVGATHLKVLFFDGSGMVIFYKRLDRGTFQIPEPRSKTERHVEIDDATLDALLDGIDVNEGSSTRSRSKTH